MLHLKDASRDKNELPSALEHAWSLDAGAELYQWRCPQFKEHIWKNGKGLTKKSGDFSARGKKIKNKKTHNSKDSTLVRDLRSSVSLVLALF